VADIVAAGNLAHRLAVTVAAPDCLALLVLGQFRFAAELLSGAPASGRDAAPVISMRW
jgi:hypothetical protein